MHVLHIIDSLGLGGAERMLVDIANATAADGHRVSVCVTRIETALAPSLDSQIELLILKRQRKVSFSATARLARWVRTQKVDVLHVHMRSSLQFILLLRAARLISVPIVFHDHYGLIETDKSIPMWFRLGHRLIERYVGVYDQLREWAVSAGMPPAKTTTIANGIDLSRFTGARRINVRAELEIAAAIPLGVLVASFKREKGIELMIEAVALSRYRGRMRIIVAGGGLDTAYARECRDLLRRHDLEETVAFIGARKEIESLLAEADFGLLSSHSESGPLVLVEYLACRLPIVSTLVGDIGRRLAACEIPGFVPIADPASFASALDQLLDLPSAKRKVRGELGHRQLATTWDIRDVMAKWYETYGVAIRGSGVTGRA